MSDGVDVTNCDREPIHVPGAIQPHGVLFACRGDALEITQVSLNLGALFAGAPEDVLSRPLAGLLGTESWTRIDEARLAGFPRERNPLTVESCAGVVYDAIVHRSLTPGVVIVELEPQREALLGFHPRMRASVHRFQDAADTLHLSSIAAEEVRALTGFDRVMVYRFDHDWNGHVVAESKAAPLETFLGLHYPAADIPAQARRLYTLNTLRIIPDIAYQPARLLPERDPGSGVPLDLSFSVLRSVSPIHIEYLRNMGVTASMSVSLVRDDQLIGLIACHHYSGPHYVPFMVRETAEYLGQALSWHIATLESRDTAERALRTQRCESRLVRAVASASSLADGLLNEALLELTDAAGAALVYEGNVYEFGTTPGQERIRELAAFLSEPAQQRLFVSDRLRDSLPGAAEWDDSAAGVLAVDISRALGEYIIWFRPPTERTVDWAGDPRKRATEELDPGAPRLSPRGSFALWREVVRGRSLPWEPWQIEGASDLRKLLLGKIRTQADQLRELNDQLAAADRAKDDFLATVSHELRTPLNAMLGWVQMLRSGILTTERRERALETVERNARAQGQLIDDILDVSRIMSGTLQLHVETVALGAVVEQGIETIRPAADAKQIRIQAALDSTASIMGDPERLQQVVGNLLMNAIKFTPAGGRVQVLVERRDSSVDFTVADTGQGISPDFLPHLFERFRQGDAGISRKAGGLGLGLAIVRHLTELHGGTVTAFSEGESQGATFTVRLPLSVVARRDSTLARSSLDAGRFPCPPALSGQRVLVVDDEPDARELLQAILEQCAATVALAGSAAEGLRLLGSFQPHLLISDIGMPGIDGLEFIGQVRRRSPEEGGGIPAIALTAYARAEDRTGILHAGFHRHVPKPIEPALLLAVIASLIARR